MQNQVGKFDKLCLKLRQTCPKCGQERFATAFRRRLTRRQAEARGYDLVRLEASGRWPTIPCAVCVHCQPNRRYKPSIMSIKQIEEAIYNGVVRAQTATPMIQKKQALARRAQLDAVVRRWDATRDAPWQALMQTLGKEIIRVQHRYRLTGDPFLALYIAECKRLQALLRVQARNGGTPPRLLQDKVDPLVLNVWETLDEPQRVQYNSRKPLLLFRTTDEDHEQEQ